MTASRFFQTMSLADHLAEQSLETLKENARQLWIVARETGREMTRHKRTLSHWNPLLEKPETAKAKQELDTLFSLQYRLAHFAALTGQALVRKAQEEGPLTGPAQYNLLRHTRMTRKIMTGVSRAAEKSLRTYRCNTNHAVPEPVFVRLGYGVALLAGGKIILDFFAPAAIPLETQRILFPLAGTVLAGLALKPELIAARQWARSAYSRVVKKETPFPTALNQFLEAYNHQTHASHSLLKARKNMKLQSVGVKVEGGCCSLQ